MAFSDGYWQSANGLTLHYRRHSPAEGTAGTHLPILCLHGLTRNARDFEALADRLSEMGHDVLVPEMRGRGMSDSADEIEEYHLETYAADVEALLAELGWSRFIAVGTSLGGLMTMMLAAADAGRIAGAVINDVGPTLHMPGLQRIAANVLRQPSFPTWVHAARAVADQNEAVHPDWELGDWIGHAKRVMRLSSSGRIVFDHDPRIGQAFGDPAELADADAWPAWLALKEVPLLLLRGEVSDLLTTEQAEMAVAALDKATLVTIPRAGHTPTLTEPESLAAIDVLIARAEAG